MTYASYGRRVHLTRPGEQIDHLQVPAHARAVDGAIPPGVGDAGVRMPLQQILHYAQVAELACLVDRSVPTLCMREWQSHVIAE